MPCITFNSDTLGCFHCPLIRGGTSVGFKIEDGVLTKYTESVFAKTDVVVPDNVKKIGAKAFGMCSTIKSITLPAGITEIGSEAFKGCTALENIYLPDSIMKIGAESFRNCSSLKTVVLPDRIPEIREYTFCNCLALKSVIMPEKLKSIEIHSFYGCKSLEYVEIPDRVTEISDFVFCGCTALGQIKLHDKITRIGSSAFWGCAKLKTLVLPEELKEIGDFAFRDCVSLPELSIPDGIEKIGKDAFANCSQMQIIVPQNYHSVRGSFAGCKVKLRESKKDKLTLDDIIARNGEQTEVAYDSNMLPYDGAPETRRPSETRRPPETRRKPYVKGFTELTKPRYYHPGSILQTKNILGYDISSTPLSWERVPLPIIERMIESRDYESDMYLPMKYSIVAAVFLKDRQPEATSFIWRNTVDLITYFINVNDYSTVKGLFQCGKFVTSKNILPLLECAIDRAQSGGDMKMQVFINNYYLLNLSKAGEDFVNEQYSEETRSYLHELDIIERSINDLRMMLKAGADQAQIVAGANELFGVFADFRATLPDELSDLFNKFSEW